MLCWRSGIRILSSIAEGRLVGASPCAATRLCQEVSTSPETASWQVGHQANLTSYLLTSG